MPWTETEDRGYSTQACNVNDRMGRFSELEYHVPAVGPGTGRQGCEDVSQVWAFRGTTEEIRAVAHTLLSPEI